MRIISRKALRDFWSRHPDAEQPLRSWFDDVKRAKWRGPGDLKAVYRNASFVANNRVVFNIKGNNYRLIVAINYAVGIVYIRFVGTHGQYDRIDAATI
ncbi:MAG TPA: type II toxin-antitoxin system HigB family toxin [Burkholderiales bacterium]|nr:type II toxin-antitoxin system HigB family toxin [Burkholderiales bacterium]